MSDLLSVLAPWMRAQRWYAAKSSGLTPDLRILAQAELPIPVPDKPKGFLASLRRPPRPDRLRAMIYLIEDSSGNAPVLYQVPLALRDTPLDDADASDALIGLATLDEGRYLVYDGPRDSGWARAHLAFLLSGPDAGAGPNTGARAGAGAGAETGTEANAEPEAGPGADAGARAGGGPDAGAGAATEAGPTGVGASPSEETAELSLHAVREAGWTVADRSVTSRVLTGEQSNTSIIHELAPRPDGTTAPPIICKVFRVVQEGLNPDIELQGMLSLAGNAHVAPVAGSISGVWGDDRGGLQRPHPGAPPLGPRPEASLAFAQEFLPGVEDAWRVALDAARAGDDFSGQARALGAATAGVHRELASSIGTVPTTAEDASALVDAMQERLDAAAEEVPELASARSGLTALFEAARHVEWPDRQRIHGDYHLGQVLWVQDRGWILLDFEGEPLKPLAERVLPDLAVKDVAGMLRSFDYAAGSVQQEGVDATAWAAQAREAFLDGYREGAAPDTRTPNPDTPDSPAGTDTCLLRAYEADKAVYEAVYEARNRPTWLAIPLGGIERLLSR